MDRFLTQSNTLRVVVFWVVAEQRFTVFRHHVGCQGQGRIARYFLFDFPPVDHLWSYGPREGVFCGFVEHVQHAGLVQNIDVPMTIQ